MYVRNPSVAATFIAIIVALTSCSKPESESRPVVTVQTATASKMSLQQVVAAEAVLFPKNEAAITPKVVAPVKQFFVNRGSHVHQGELLAILENKDVSAAVTENRGTFEQAQAQYETTTRASLPEDLKKAQLDAQASKEAFEAEQKVYESRQKLYKDGALPRKDLDQSAVALAQARSQSVVAQEHLAAMEAVGKQSTLKSAAGQLASAEGKYKGAQAQLSYTEIRSPISGVVTDRPVWPGETAPAGSPLLTIMDTSSVVARAHVPQEQAALLKPGNAATLIAPDLPPVTGKVMIVSPALDPSSTTVEIWVEAQNKSGKLRPGSTVQLQIVARTIQDAIAIPQEALLKTPEGGTSVMVVGDQSKAQRRDVETGIHSGDLVQITKGLSAGESVITTGAYGLPDNTEVKVQSAAKSVATEPVRATD